MNNDFSVSWPSRIGQDGLFGRAANAREDCMRKRGSVLWYFRVLIAFLFLHCSMGSLAFSAEQRPNKEQPGYSQGAENDLIVMLHFNSRPPYVIAEKEDAFPTGVVAEPAERAFKQAKIPFVWKKTPVNRQFALIKANEGFHCAIGFEKTAWREKFANFSKPLYVSGPFIAITSLKVNEKSGVTLKYMLSKYTIVAKENLSQGDVVTELIMKSPHKYLTSAPSRHLVQMIAKGHGDFMLISSDELEYYIQHGEIDPKDIHVLTLSDVNIRFSRRIMCNKRVDDRVIKKLDQVIETRQATPTAFKKVE